METHWHLEWPHGALDLHALGGMLGGVRLRVDGDRWVRPFYEAPWIGEGKTLEPKLLEHLRSEFPCVPFGGTYPAEALVPAWQKCVDAQPSSADFPLGPIDDVVHGPGCVSNWTLEKLDGNGITIAVNYPSSSPISRLERTVRCDPDRPAIDLSLTIESRAHARRPVGLHPNLALPATPGAFRIVPGAFRFGVVHPVGPEKGVSRARPGAVFDDLRRVPLAAAGTAPFDRLPFAYDTEEIVQLCGSDGRVTLINDEEQIAYQLTWDSAQLPSLLLWMSNRGRTGTPWSGRNVCVGVEPLAGVFDLGSRAALAENPISSHGVETALLLDPASPTTISYRFEVLAH